MIKSDCISTSQVVILQFLLHIVQYTVQEKSEKRYCPHPHRCPPLLRPRPPPPFSSAHPHPPTVCGQRKNIFSSHQPYTSLKLHSPPTSGHRRLTPPRHHNHPCHRRTTTLVPVLQCPLLRSLGRHRHENTVSAPCARFCGAHPEAPQVVRHCCYPAAVSEPPHVPSSSPLCPALSLYPPLW